MPRTGRMDGGYHDSARSDQATQPLGDVEIRVVDGGDLVVVLLGGFVVAQRLGDAAEAVMQGEEVVLVFGIERASGPPCSCARPASGRRWPRSSGPSGERLDLLDGDRCSGRAPAGTRRSPRRGRRCGPGSSPSSKCSLASSGWSLTRRRNASISYLLSIFGQLVELDLGARCPRDAPGPAASDCRSRRFRRLICVSS